ncbi:MAG TPA: glycoside hydrolase family 3 N-terminal domain-containing protein, partial [Solirubrobacterales bacterium]|nr:glycoside hydrolase family 3 N-terminal domain-containing protein [Solirubrobacterales bacterium]
LPDRRLVGQRLITGLPGTEVSARVRGMIRRGEVAGVILFADNFPTRDAGRRLVRELRRIPRPARLRDPLLVMIDQEGGLVKRIDGAPTDSAAEIGRDGPAAARRQGVKTARNLKNVGVNVNLAPVLDVARPGGDIAETDRAFGSTAAQVRRTAIPFARAMQHAGVVPTAKHFPGMGAARLNTDFARQVIRVSRARLRALDMAPYRPFIADDRGADGKARPGGMVMLSTAIYPAFSELPAAFAPEIATGELRGRMGFKGVSITDAMGTVAVEEFGSPATATLAATRAGVDLLLYTDPAGAAGAHRTLSRQLRAGNLPRPRFRLASARVLALRASLAE